MFQKLSCNLLPMPSMQTVCHVLPYLVFKDTPAQKLLIIRKLRYKSLTLVFTSQEFPTLRDVSFSLQTCPFEMQCYVPL